MNPLLDIIIYTTLAGACIPVGGLIARIERLRPDWLEREFRHFIIAFGGGVLLAAVALVLIPEGLLQVAAGFESGLYILAGGLSFFAFEKWLGVRRREAPQFSAMLLDYIPESLALGGIFAVNAKAAPLLAILIGLQNLPEGFNTYRELKAIEGKRPGRVMWLMTAMLPLGPLLALIGWLYLATAPYILGVVMLFAAGGILYLMFQDIAPQARMQRHWAPPLGAVLGFVVALLGKLVLNGGI